MLRRSFLLPFALVALTGVAPAMAAQGRVIDEGVFSITVPGAPPRLESFRIARSDTNIVVATSSVSMGARHIRSTLTTDSLGTPITYHVTVTDNGSMVSDVNASAHAGRLSALTHTNQRGDETMREYPVTVGRSIILDEDLLHQIYFAAVIPRNGRVELLSPRAARSARGTLSAHGLTSIDVAGKSVTATHYTLEGAVSRDFWVDASGRLLRVEIPSLGLKAVREELPK